MRVQADLQADFAGALFAGPPPAGLGNDAELRFSVYRNNVVHGLSKALAQRFPVIETLLGGESFVALARQFLGAHPPASPLLFAWGEELPGYLDQLPALAAYPYLGDVARLEWARGLAWHAADALPVAPARLAGVAGSAATLTLRLHPSLAVLRTRYAAVSIWRAHQPGESPVGLNPMRSEIALILRNPQDQIVTEPLEPADAAMLGALQEGKTLLQALTTAGPGHDPTRLLMRLVRHGAITGLEGEIE